jgi:hypothetical protein
MPTNNGNANNGSESNRNGNDANGNGSQTFGPVVPNRNMAPLSWLTLISNANIDVAVPAVIAFRDGRPVLWQFPNLLQAQEPHTDQMLIAMRRCDPWCAIWSLWRYAAIPKILGPPGFDYFLGQIRGGVREAVPITIDQAWRLSQVKHGLDYDSECPLVELELPDAAQLAEGLSADTAASADERDLDEHYFPRIISWLCSDRSSPRPKPLCCICYRRLNIPMMGPRPGVTVAQEIAEQDGAGMVYPDQTVQQTEQPCVLPCDHVIGLKCFRTYICNQICSPTGPLPLRCPICREFMIAVEHDVSTVSSGQVVYNS